MQTTYYMFQLYFENLTDADSFGNRNFLIAHIYFLYLHIYRSKPQAVNTFSNKK